MKKIGLVVVLVVVIAVLSLWPAPLESCVGTYVYSYSNSQATAYGGYYPVCAGSGSTCLESGNCNGSGHCVSDGFGVTICLNPDVRPE